jgi:anti-sigma factor RsiW
MRRALPCAEVAELLTAYLDGAVPRRLRRALVRHLSGCPHCSRLLAQLVDVTRRLGLLHEPGLRPTARIALRAAFRSRVTDLARRRLRP